MPKTSQYKKPNTYARDSANTSSVLPTCDNFKAKSHVYKHDDFLRTVGIWLRF